MQSNIFKYSNYLKLSLLSIILVNLSSVCFAAPDKNASDENFWGNLYKNGGNTFYCNKPFKKKGPLISESYIYSTSWIRDHLDCGTKRQCKRNNPNYNSMVSDLHNIVPSDSYFEFKRKNTFFGTLDDTVEPNSCGIRHKHYVLEPSDRLKGDIARILLYMHQQYNLPLNTNLSLLRLWNKADKPDAAEKKRDLAIKEIQGNSNPFIYDSSLIDKVQL